MSKFKELFIQNERLFGLLGKDCPFTMEMTHYKGGFSNSNGTPIPSSIKLSMAASVVVWKEPKANAKIPISTQEKPSVVPYSLNSFESQTKDGLSLGSCNYNIMHDPRSITEQAAKSAIETFIEHYNDFISADYIQSNEKLIKKLIATFNAYSPSKKPKVEEFDSESEQPETEQKPKTGRRTLNKDVKSDETSI